MARRSKELNRAYQREWSRKTREARRDDPAYFAKNAEERAKVAVRSRIYYYESKNDAGFLARRYERARAYYYKDVEKSRAKCRALAAQRRAEMSEESRAAANTKKRAYYQQNAESLKAKQRERVAALARAKQPPSKPTVRTKEEKRAYNRAYYLAHREERRVSCLDPEFKKKRNAELKERYLSDPEFRSKLRARANAYRAANSIACKEAARAKYRRSAAAHKASAAEWAKKNPEKRSEIRKRWWARNPEARKVHKHKRRVRELTAVSTLTASEWRKILASSPTCRYCAKPFTKTQKPTMDHVIPLAKGGPHTKENVVAACGSCNSHKGAKLLQPL